MIETPKYCDHCNHGHSNYICTVELSGKRYVDVYAYNGNNGEQKLCLRYSDIPSDNNNLSLTDLVNYSKMTTDYYCIFTSLSILGTIYLYMERKSET